jgi:thiol-disulfide isomerase/thioredoxin
MVMHPMKIPMLSAMALLLGGCAAGQNGPDFSDEPPSDSGKKTTSTSDSGTPDPGEPDAQEPVDTGPPPCTYPSGPYGKTQGSTVPPNLTWQGYAPGSSSVSTISTSDLYDCDGRFGIHAILFAQSALWCGVCQQEAQIMPQWMQTWGPQGVKIGTLIIQDQAGQPANASHALLWRNNFNLGSIAYVVADPAFSFAHSGNNGLPMNILIDPRTMKVVKIVEGYGGMDPAVSQLALKNK